MKLFADSGVMKLRLWKSVSILLGLMYICFLALDLFFEGFALLSDCIKFLCIVILFLLQLYYGRRDHCLWIAAALITVIADFFLLFTQYYALGILIFCFAHFARLCHQCPSLAKASVVFVASAFVAGIDFFPALICAGICYAILLLANTACAFKKKNREISLAYILFILCDISVLLTYLGPELLQGFARPAIWLFYLPSQFLLADAMIWIERKAEGAEQHQPNGSDENRYAPEE